MTPNRKLTFCALLCSTSLLSGCNETAPDPRTQIGAKPDLPAQQQYLLLPMHVASVVGWKNGERPSVPNNLKIDAIATGLQHPRSLYTLPNGDILVIESKAPGTEPIKRPKDFIMKWVESWATWREYLTADDLEREKVLESFGVPMIRLNQFNLGKDPVTTIDRLIRDASREYVTVILHTF